MSYIFLIFTCFSLVAMNERMPVFLSEANSGRVLDAILEQKIDVLENMFYEGTLVPDSTLYFSPTDSDDKKNITHRLLH